jgi:hypothetical protein
LMAASGPGSGGPAGTSIPIEQRVGLHATECARGVGGPARVGGEWTA